MSFDDVMRDMRGDGRADGERSSGADTSCKRCDDAVANARRGYSMCDGVDFDDFAACRDGERAIGDNEALRAALDDSAAAVCNKLHVCGEEHVVDHREDSDDVKIVSADASDAGVHVAFLADDAEAGGNPVSDMFKEAAKTAGKSFNKAKADIAAAAETTGEEVAKAAKGVAKQTGDAVNTVKKVICRTMDNCEDPEQLKKFEEQEKVKVDQWVEDVEKEIHREDKQKGTGSPVVDDAMNASNAKHVKNLMERGKKVVDDATKLHNAEEDLVKQGKAAKEGENVKDMAEQSKDMMDKLNAAGADEFQQALNQIKKNGEAVTQAVVNGELGQQGVGGEAGYSLNRFLPAAGNMQDPNGQVQGAFRDGAINANPVPQGGQEMLDDLYKSPDSGVAGELEMEQAGQILEDPDIGCTDPDDYACETSNLSGRIKYAPPPGMVPSVMAPGMPNTAPLAGHMGGI